MDKAQAIHSFWSSFGLPAYDEYTVPENATMPYITYSVATDSLDAPVVLTGSLWYKTSSWADIEQKAEIIAETISKMQPPSIGLDNGRLYITKGTPFAQRMGDPDETVKRIYIVLNAEFLTQY